MGTLYPLGMGRPVPPLWVTLRDRWGGGACARARILMGKHKSREQIKIRTLRRLMRKREGLLQYLEEAGVDISNLDGAKDRVVLATASEHFGVNIVPGRATIGGLHYAYSRGLKLAEIPSGKLPELQHRRREVDLTAGAHSFAEAQKFYASYEWRRLRYRALLRDDATCRACGARAGAGVMIQVDHIKPLRRHWGLRLDLENVQCLCNLCNHGKGSWDETDWRDRRGRSVPRRVLLRAIK